MNIDEIVDRIHAESVRREMNVRPDPVVVQEADQWELNHANRLTSALNNVEAKSHLPTLLPPHLRRFPFNFRWVQNLTIKMFGLLFGRQRELGLAIHNTLRALSAIAKEQNYQIQALRNALHSAAQQREVLRVDNEQAIARLDERQECLDARQAVLDERQRCMDRRQTSNETYLHYELRAQKDTLVSLSEMAQARLPEPLERDAIERIAAITDHTNDPLYSAFEDEYRGGRQLVRDRLSVYLPLVQEAREASGSSQALDLGCGRGEWLQLLSEQELTVQGVDMNSTMVQHCRELGLDAEEQDILEKLRKAPADCYAAISAFHVIEHIPFESLLELAREACRALKPGGVLILETPNPLNILVSSADFYRDPSHNNPVHPDTLSFFVRKCGLVENTVYALDDADEGRRLKPMSEYKFETLDSYAHIPRDYTLVARKSP